jgi:hypothetical protein
MSYELSNAVELHRATIEEMMHIGGSATFAATTPVELREPILRPDGTAYYTHVALERFQRHEDQVIDLERGREHVHFTPELVVAVSSPQAPESVAYGVQIQFADFTLSAPFLPDGERLPRKPGLLLPARYQIGYSTDPEDAFAVFQNTVKAGDLRGHDERGRHVARAAAAVSQLMESIEDNGYSISRPSNRDASNSAWPA